MKTSLGEFEHHVLLAALRLGKEGFTASIVAELEARAGRETSAAAVYIALRRLERAGLVETRLIVRDDHGERRERRHVWVTPAGIKLAREARARFVNLWRGLAVIRGDAT